MHGVDASVMPAPLHEILYLSTIDAAMAVEAVLPLARQAHSNNSALRITGMLAFDGVLFCQQIEGPTANVRRLFSTIAADPRHGQVRILHSAPLAERRFNRFAMGYTALDDDEELLQRLGALRGGAAVAAFTGLVDRLDPP